ncbi:MAG: formylglycine-generating enzyme family protein [Bacteroidia bacterium]|nr:formylglycine-generating enzyme family protein [Bacteroidia bacterium]
MYKYLGVIFLAFVLISCNKNETQVTVANESKEPDTIKPVEVDVKMVYILGGEYLPFYGDDSVLVDVKPFYLDERPVTNKEFLAFVTANPQWRKSAVKRVYADSNYLKYWVSDLELPPGANPDAPVCNVSWFAAKWFAESVGKRLPTLDEWEFVAMADADTPNARRKPSYSDYIVDLYLVKDKHLNPVKQSAPNYWGVYNMFDLIWEWTDDFNSILVTGDSRTGQYDDKGLFCAGAATNSTDVMNYAAFMRFGLRTSLKARYTVANLGFRCAKDAPIENPNK